MVLTSPFPLRFLMGNKGNDTNSIMKSAHLVFMSLARYCQRFSGDTQWFLLLNASSKAYKSIYFLVVLSA